MYLRNPYYTKFKCAVNFKILKMSTHVKAAIYTYVLNAPTKKTQRTKILRIVAKMFPVRL